MKADFHVHSKHSKRPSEWILKKLGCPESFTEPMQIYTVAMQKGMGLVTITDHNTIDGCLEIAHLPNTFISEEVTTYFPEDGCKLHVLVFNIDEKKHQEIQNLRNNVFDLTDYLNAEQIVHALAHPLYSINNKLTLEHLEQALLLFKTLEINGARDEEQNMCLPLLASALTQEKVDLLTDKHGIVPAFEAPWRKNFVGGSDDHSSLAIARKFTEIKEAFDAGEMLRGIVDGRAVVWGHGSTPKGLARTIYSVAYQYYEHRFKLDGYFKNDMIFTVLDKFLRTGSDRQPGLFARLNFYWNYAKSSKSEEKTGGNTFDVLRKEAYHLIRNDRRDSGHVATNRNNIQNMDEQWFGFVNRVSNKVVFHFADKITESLSQAHFVNLFDHLGAAGLLYGVLAPYFVSFSLHSEEKKFAKSALSHFLCPKSGSNKNSDEIKVAHFTDTLYEVNGVSETLKRQIKSAIKFNKYYQIITCDAAKRPEGDGIKRFRPLGMYELSVYPDQKLFVPPLLEMVDYCFSEGFTHIHAATPGFLGLAALAIARILRLPLIGTYHTALPEYAEYLTGDSGVAEVIRKYTTTYYDQMELIFVPSRATASELMRCGISPTKIRISPRGVDTELFHPSKRTDFFPASDELANKLKLLYVGRISKEKNLSILANAFRSLARSTENIALIVVGDGPYREEMQASLQGTPSIFTGYLQGEALAAVYAASDLFVFPSTTDTFGNVVLEAQASGIPVIVTDMGGPCENIIPGKTGIILKGGDEEHLLNELKTLLQDPIRLKRMGKAAREYAKNRSFDSAFLESWDMYSEVSGEGHYFSLQTLIDPIFDKKVV